MTGLGTTADQPTISPAPPLPEKGRQGQLLAFHPMAAYGDDVPMHSTLSKLGMSWPEYVDAKVRPQIDWGLRAFCFHLPHGKQDPPGPMAFDGYLMALKRTMPWAKGFTKAIRPLVKDGIRVICYMGSLDAGKMLDLRDKPYGDDGYFVRFGQSIRPYVNAGCEIAFDAASRWKIDGPEHCFARGLRNLGTPVHIEGTEFVEKKRTDVSQFPFPRFRGHLRDLPIIANWQHLRDNLLPQPGTHPTKRYDNPRLYSAITTLLNGHSAPRNPDGSKKDLAWIHGHAAEWVPPMVREALAVGDCCLFMFDPIMAMTKKDLLG